MLNPIKWFYNQVIDWLVYEDEPTGLPPCDYERLSFEIRPCDIILVEGRSRVSEVIKTVTHSPWTHSAIYIGRLVDIEDPNQKEHISWLYDGHPDDQLIIEPLLGEGTIISPLKRYAGDHLRICRPQGISMQDVQKVISHCAQHLGHDYDVRQMLDLARYLFPYSLIPRRWRSSLFEHNVGETTKTVCSSMIAMAFNSIQYPILPVSQKHQDGFRLFKRNTKITTPSDFDYSPYFEIIKYPILGLNDLSVYRTLPWDQDGVICNNENDCFIPNPDSNSKPFPVDVKNSKKNLPSPDSLYDEHRDTSDSSTSNGDIDSANFTHSS